MSSFIIRERLSGPCKLGAERFPGEVARRLTGEFLIVCDFAI